MRSIGAEKLEPDFMIELLAGNYGLHVVQMLKEDGTFFLNDKALQCIISYFEEVIVFRKLEQL